jgi:acetyltransferase
MLDWAESNGIGFSSVISTGASADIDFGEILDYLAYDPQTKGILLYIEGIRDARRFMSALRNVSRLKPIVIIKVGRHEAGSKAAQSHTGALAGSDAVFDALIRRAGVVRVKTIMQLFSCARALSTHIKPSGNRLATKVGYQGCIFSIRWNMPAPGTDSLRSFDGRILHHFVPLI